MTLWAHVALGVLVAAGTLAAAVWLTLAVAPYTGLALVVAVAALLLVRVLADHDDRLDELEEVDWGAAAERMEAWREDAG